MAAATTLCPKCGAEVPCSNFALHELRCTGKAAAVSTASRCTGKAAAVSTASRHDSHTPLTEVAMATQLVQALTWARTRPEEVVEALHERLQHFKGKDYYPPERKGGCVVTKEGPSVVEEAIAFVSSLQPMAGVGNSSELGLALAGEDHIADVGQTGTASHSSSDGTSASERAKRYGSFCAFGECLWYGSDCANAQTIVLDLIVDDGVPSRGHRMGVFNSTYNMVGVAYGQHATFGRMAALEFAKDWQGNTMFIRARMQGGPVKLSKKVVEHGKAQAKTQWELGTCPLCNESIKGGKVVEIPALGGKLHAKCFKCAGCSTQLCGVPFQVQASVPYCNSCFFDRYGETCQACKKVITGGMMKCALGKFHIECVVCATCGNNIGKEKFSTVGNAITCQACAAGANRSNLSSPQPGKAKSLSSAGNNIIGQSRVPESPAPKAGPTRTSTMAKAKAKVGSVAAARAKPQAKMSMNKAHSKLMDLTMDYSSLM